MMKYLCDNCESDLTTTQADIAYRISLSSELIPRNRNPVERSGVTESDPLPITKHFCNLACLTDYL